MHVQPLAAAESFVGVPSFNPSYQGIQSMFGIWFNKAKLQITQKININKVSPEPLCITNKILMLVKCALLKEKC